MTNQGRMREKQVRVLQSTRRRRQGMTSCSLNCTAILLSLAVCLPVSSAFGFADLRPGTEQTFDRYIQLTEAGMKRPFSSSPFLWLDSHPEEQANARKGEQVVAPCKTQDAGKDIEVPGGMIQDWLGAVFIPGASIARVRDVLQDYPNYKKLFAPEVIESKITGNEGDRYRVFLRLYKKQILTVVLNADYDITYTRAGPDRLMVDSRSMRIAQVKDPRGDYRREYPPGHDDGFLWRLNSYWRFEQADGGVYGECRAISLSRDVPFVGWMLRGFLERFPKDSMINTLTGLKAAVRTQGGVGF